MKRNIGLGGLLLGSAAILSACGGASSNATAANSDGSSGGATSQIQATPSSTSRILPPTQLARTLAAQHTALHNSMCTSITPFYWEIGDKNSVLASGTGGTGNIAPPTAQTVMPIASASKWFFSTYVAEIRRGAMSANDIKFLNFQSGYTNFNECTANSTVGSCLAEPGATRGSNGDYIASTDGKFFYNGGHMQVLANNIGLGADGNARLAYDINTALGNSLNILYSQPQLAGGIDMSADRYGAFLRNMLSGRYSMSSLLGSHAVCTHTNSLDCPSAMFSPVNQSRPSGPNDVSNERWHYSLGHWVEDDPTVGDGSFSSPGRFGFYPWIDANKTYYGVLARYDAEHVKPVDPKQAAYYTSVECGREIRKAWETGQAQ